MKIVAVGKIKKRFVLDGIEYYQKQIPKLKVIEVKQSNMEEEGKLILKKLKPTDYVIALDIKGNALSSEDLALKIDKLRNKSKNIVFVIGGSTGLSDEVKNISNYKLSFSKMTFPHELFRLILIEQIYRALSILNKSPYHK